MKSMVKTDTVLSGYISDFLDEEFYTREEIKNFARHNDKETQVSGVDVTFEYNGREYHCDEKASVKWRNLPTFILELSFLAKDGSGKVLDGWFVKEDATDSYMFVWQDMVVPGAKEGEEKKSIQFDYDDIRINMPTQITVALVRKEKIIEELEKRGITIEYLKEKAKRIRESKEDNPEPMRENGFKFNRGWNLAEDPINLLFWKNEYLKIADLVWHSEYPGHTKMAMKKNIHNFNEDLAFEQSQFQLQDNFYKKLGAREVVRTKYNTKIGKALQRDDIDVVVTFDSGIKKLSEKHREQDYGDILIEMHSKYPNEPGWIKKSKADGLAYFVKGKKVFLLNMPLLKQLFLEKFEKQIPDEYFEELKRAFPQKGGSQAKTITVDGEEVPITLVQAYNQTGKSEWYTESVGIPVSWLRKAGLKISEKQL